MPHLTSASPLRQQAQRHAGSRGVGAGAWSGNFARDIHHYILVFGSWTSFDEFHFQPFLGMIDEVRIWSTPLDITDLTTNLGEKFGLIIYTCHYI